MRGRRLLLVTAASHNKCLPDGQVRWWHVCLLHTYLGLRMHCTAHQTEAGSS